MKILKIFVMIAVFLLPLSLAAKSGPIPYKTGRSGRTPPMNRRMPPTPTTTPTIASTPETVESVDPVLPSSEEERPLNTPTRVNKPLDTSAPDESSSSMKDEEKQEEPKVIPKGMVEIKFKDGHIKELIKEFSEILEKNFTYDDTVKGQITLIGENIVTKYEARKIFESALERMGYAVVWGWPINKVVPITKATTEGNSPVY